MQTINEPWFKEWYQTFAENSTEPTTDAMYHLSKAGYGEPLMDYHDKMVYGWVWKIMDIGEGDYLEGKVKIMEAILTNRLKEKKRETIKRYYAKIYNHYLAFIPVKEMFYTTTATAMALEQWYEVGITEADAIFEEADDD